MVRVFYWPFSVSSIIVISSVIGYFGVSDADVVLREDEPSPNKRQQHLRRQLQLHPLRHYNKDEGSVRDNESETETDHGPTDAWLDDSMWQQIVIRALANPTEWVQLRQALDKVDADLRALTSQENASHNHSKSAPKWKFTYHRVTNPELSSSSSSSNNLKNLHYKAKAIAAVLAVSPPSSPSSSSFYSNNVQDKDINRIVSTTTTISTPKTTVTTTTSPSTPTSPEISNFDSEPKLSIIGNANLPVPHYYLHHHRNQNYLNSRNSENDLETAARERNHKIKFPTNHSSSSSSSPISTVGRTQLETEVLMMSSFSNDDRKENGRRVHRTKHEPMHIPSQYSGRPAWIQHPNPNYIPYSTMHDEPSPSPSLLGHKNKNILKSSPSSSSSSSSSEFFIHSAAQPKKIVENRRRHNDDFSEEEEQDEEDEEQDKFHNAVVHQLHSNTENEQENILKKEKEEAPRMKTITSNFPWTSNVAVEKESSRRNSNPSSSSSNSNSGDSTYNSHSYHHRRHQPRRTSGHHHSHHHHQHQHYHQVR